MLSKAHLNSHSKMSGSRWVITPSWSRSWRSFLYSSSVYSCHLFLISSASVSLLPTKVRLVKVMVFPVVMYRCKSWTVKKAEQRKIDALNCGVGEDSWESLGLQRDPTSPSWRRSVLGVHWKDWCWSWNSNTLATSCKELTHWKRLWCWEGLGAGGEGDDRGWDGSMASPTQWTWIWVNSGSWWWTGRPGVLWFMGSQRVGHDWATELNLVLAQEMYIYIFAVVAVVIYRKIFLNISTKDFVSV